MTKVSTITPCYNMGEYIEGFLKNVSTQTHKNLEIVLDHNDPTEAEIKLVEEHNDKHDNIFHIQVEGVDPIGISMNRRIENATGDYLCIWNVDDLRTPDSIEVMAKTLDDNPDVDFVYGNYHIVPSFGSTNGQYVDETGKEEYLKVGMILGPFFMFRKSALKKSGVFDEQLVEEDYEDIVEKKYSINANSGWLGITDKYWITSLIPEKNSEIFYNSFNSLGTIS